MYAVIETGGKQLKVEEGSVIFTEKLDVKEGDSYTFDKVVAVENNGLKLGKPSVEGASVACKVVKQGKEKKITIFKYKAKKGSTRRKQGHRQPYTKFVVESIKA